MRYILILAATAAFTLAGTQNAEAARRTRGYTRTRTVWQSPNRGGGLWSRMMELERRKNDFLFGRR